MNELRICPFCKGSARIAVCDDEGNVRNEEYESDTWSGIGYRIVHESYDCPIATGENGYSLIYDSREEAKSHWNRRVCDCDFYALIALANDLEFEKDMRWIAGEIRTALGVE